jgi:D-hexose-6-phosphate mutarotase
LVPTLTEYARLPVLPWLSSARSMKLETPLPVGVPVMAPVFGSIESPAGKVPDEME